MRDAAIERSPFQDADRLPDGASLRPEALDSRALTEGAAPRRPWMWAVVLMVGFLLVAGTQLGTAPVTSKREDRCHDIVRNILVRGDWVVPWRHGGPWINKPPLLYWSAASLSKLSGGYSLWALRLPSLLGGAVLLLLALQWGRSLGGWRVGLLAMALLAPMKGLQDMSREGSGEMLLAALCGLALFAYDRGGRQGHPGWRWPFAVLLALAILTKATVALMIVGVPIAVDLTWRRQWSQVLKGRHWLALSAALVAGFSWYAYILWAVPGAWERLFSELVLPVGVKTENHTQAHFGPPTEHFGNILRLTLPVAVLMPLLLWRGIKTRLWRHAPGWRLVAVVLLSLFVAFSLAPKKRTDYLLPLLPFTALLLAESTLAFVQLAPRAWTRYLRVMGIITLILGGAVLAAVALWFGEVRGGGRPVEIAIGVVGGGALVAGLVWSWRGASLRFASVTLLCWGLGLATMFGSIDLWKRQFMAGVASQEPGYDAASWNVAFERYPRLLEKFKPDEMWVRNRLETPGNEAFLSGEMPRPRAAFDAESPDDGPLGNR